MIENIVDEYDFVKPIKSFKTMAGYKLYPEKVYETIRETKNYIYISVKNEEEKVRKIDRDILYELVNKNFLI